MTLGPLLAASLPVQIHVATLVLAWGLGTWLVFFSRKGAPFHRIAGRLFIALMFTTAIAALFIHLRNPAGPFFGFSTFHLFVPLVLTMIALALYGAMSGKLGVHRFAVFGLYFGSLTITGLVNIFLGDGISHQLFFAH